jgi:hypothetical protein
MDLTCAVIALFLVLSGAARSEDCETTLPCRLEDAWKIGVDTHAEPSAILLSS